MARNVALSKARAAIGLTQEKLAETVGLSTSQISRFESGLRIPRVPEAQAIADRLGVSPESLFGTLPVRVPIVGYVNAGSDSVLFEEGQGGLGEVEPPDDATPTTVAVVVRGDSLGPLLNDSLIFYDDRRDPPTAELIGKLCVVGLADGRIVVKQLTKGQLPGRYTLIANVGLPIYDAEVKWAARVKDLRPR